MRKQRRTFYLSIVGLVTLAAAPAIGQAQDMPRTPSGKPDLTGTYDIATLTPLQRPERLGDRAFLTEEEAATLERRAFEGNLARNQASDPNREAPPAGGDGSRGAAGNVGGYNTFWIDRGSSAARVDGRYRRRSSQTRQMGAILRGRSEQPRAPPNAQSCSAKTPAPPGG